MDDFSGWLLVSLRINYLQLIGWNKLRHSLRINPMPGCLYISYYVVFNKQGNADKTTFVLFGRSSAFPAITKQLLKHDIIKGESAKASLAYYAVIFFRPLSTYSKIKGCFLTALESWNLKMALLLFLALKFAKIFEILIRGDQILYISTLIS